MNRISNILVIVDPTASEHPAVDKAAAIAARLGARIELFACETKESRAMLRASRLAPESAVDSVADIRAVLAAVARPLRDRGLDVCIETAMGNPLHAQLLDRTQRTSAELVIKDTHHHALAKRTFFTNTDWHLIRGCPVPLLLTKGKLWAQAPAIVAAVDPGHVNDKPLVLDNRILDWAQLLRDKLGGSLHAVHAYLPSILLAEAADGMAAMISTVTPELLEGERLKRLEELKSLAAPYGVDPGNVHAQLGVATDVVPSFAQDVNADIVVLGAISRSGLQRIFIGSTAERVLEKLPCDALVIKPPDFASMLPF